MKNKELNISEQLGFLETSDERHGPLRGHVSISVQDTKTKETSLWYEDDNIIPISGYQFILLKLFGLNLDSLHNVDFEDPGMDTNLVIPDLNYDGKPTLGIGVDPKQYTKMEEDNSHNHFVQGFMVGNGGSGEDNITTKNTDYSFVNLRNPIPFRQTQTKLDSDIANEYLGQLRLGKGSFTKSYYIKKFSKRPSVVHSWWKDGQKWDFKDPVQFGDLGPNAINPYRNNRIETYVNINFSIEEDDCVSYFNHDGSTQTALLNELGLVAFDVLPGDRSILIRAYERLIRKLIELIMDNDRIFRCPECNAIVGKPPTVDQMSIASKYVLILTKQIKTIFDGILGFPQDNTNIKEFNKLLDEIIEQEISIITEGAVLDWKDIQDKLISTTNIGVEAFYNNDGSFVYFEDKFLQHLSDSSLIGLSTDEAQRIKLMTYYTFKAIPLESNRRILINYRVYAN